MKAEFLTELGLEKSAIDKIVAENSRELEVLKTENETLKTQVSTAQGAIAQANAEIERYKGLDIDGIKKAADEWKGKAEQAERDAKAQLEAIRFDTALDTALSGARARSPKAAKALLNMEGLKLTESGIVGLSEQLEAIKKDNAFLFETESTDGGPGFGNQTAPGTQTDTSSMMNILLRSGTQNG